MKMETPKKNRVQGTYTTLKECLTDPEYLRALEIIERCEKYAYKHSIYTENEE